MRRLLYECGYFKSSRVGVPVIVVGNVVAGGAGKTPLVMALVKHLQGCGISVGVVSRGYGRVETSCQEVCEDTLISESGDEPALIKYTTGAPVFVASKRTEAARALLGAYPKTQLLVCDDGLQHYALARDIEIAVFDDRGLGNSWLLPAGPLREPWPKRLHSGIDMVLHTGQAPSFEGFTSVRQLADFAVAPDGSKVLLSSLRGKPLIALAAIANPDAFFTMLATSGLSLSRTIALPDHYDFSNYQLPVEDQTIVLCTEKDAVKLFKLPRMTSVRVLAVPLIFLPEPAFINALNVLLKPLLPGTLLSQLPSSHGH